MPATARLFLNAKVTACQRIPLDDRQHRAVGRTQLERRRHRPYPRPRRRTLRRHGRRDYDVTEFDERAGTPELHTVRGTVSLEPRATLLPPDLFKRFVNGVVQFERRYQFQEDSLLKYDCQR
jgi:hypothetical protein